MSTLLKSTWRFDRVEGSVNALRYDIAPLKGAHVRNAAVREAGLIAEDMGLTLVQTLNPEQTRTLSQSKGTTDISESDLRSFRRADLIMEVTDSNGETCYVAVEVSFTANGRDTKRAVRNAEFLTRFTGKGSKAAVAGLRRDNRVDSIFESGEVFWYQLDRSDLEAVRSRLRQIPGRVRLYSVSIGPLASGTEPAMGHLIVSRYIQPWFQLGPGIVLGAVSE